MPHKPTSLFLDRADVRVGPQQHMVQLADPPVDVLDRQRLATALRRVFDRLENVLCVAGVG